jgi:hypothetical protein
MYALDRFWGCRWWLARERFSHRGRGHDSEKDGRSE